MVQAESVGEAKLSSSQVGLRGIVDLLGVQHEYADDADPVHVPSPLAPDFDEDGGLPVAHVVVVAQHRHEASTAIRDRREDFGDPAGGLVCVALGIDQIAQQDKPVVAPLTVLVDHAVDGSLDGAARPGTGITRNSDACDRRCGDRGRRSPRGPRGWRSSGQEPEAEPHGYGTNRRATAPARPTKASCSRDHAFHWTVAGSTCIPSIAGAPCSRRRSQPPGCASSAERRLRTRVASKPLSMSSVAARQDGSRRGRHGGPVRVLMVEDEVRLAETVSRGLFAEGFVVDIVHDGAKGLDEAQSRDYDVIILDIMLPSLNGYDVCRALREADVWTPVLMLTAKDGEYDQVDAFDLGADDYLTKPFSFVVLVARLRALVRRGAPERPTVLKVGDLTLDPATRVVRRGETDIDLTPREFGVLHFLMRHRGEVVSKLEILQSVWDLNYEGDENVVEVYVGYLRRKVDLPFGRQSIQTVRGAGYRLSGAGG